MATLAAQQAHLARMPSYKPQSLMSFNYTNPLTPIERGALAVRSRNDFFRNLWGVPEDLARQLESNANMQPMDIIGMYKDRALEIPSKVLTAAILNGQASWLSDTAVPIFPTAEFNFTSQMREINCIEFTRTAAGGIPNEQTFRATSWKDSVEKVQLNARIEMDLALDPNYGEGEWLFQLGGLAANAMLTIHKTIAYSLIHTAYTNMVGENVKNSAFDLSKLLMNEEEYFGMAALDQVKYLRMIRRFEDKIPDLDTVIIPHNSVQYISELLGESTSMESQKVITDPVTGGLLWEFANGKRSVGTIQYGERMLHFVEMPQFKVNMVTDSMVEQPLKTSVTMAQVYPPDPDVKAEDNVSNMKEDNLDVYLFFQTKNQGDEQKVSIKDAYNACFYWDEKNFDGIAQHAHNFCKHKNQQVSNDANMIPWEYNDANRNAKNKEHDVNYETEHDNNNPNMDYIQGKETLQSMRGWRDQFMGLTYLPQERMFKIPKRIADFELFALPNKWIHKAAKGVAHKANCLHSCGQDFDVMMDETHSLLNDIANESWSDDYVVALINANIDKMYNYSNVSQDGTPTFEPAQRAALRDENGNIMYPDATPIPEWRGNRFGSLDLPRRTGRIRQVYPPGFDSGPGLITLAREADNENSEWRTVGERAKRVVVFWEAFSAILKKYVGPTDVNEEGLTSPWFHTQSDVAVLIDNFRPYRAPVFLAVPNQTTVSRPVTASERQVADFYTANARNDAFLLKDLTNPTGALSGTPLSDVTRYIVIVDVYTSSSMLGSNLVTSVGERSPKGYASTLNKLIAYTIDQIYNRLVASPSVSVIKQLNIVAYFSRRLSSILGGNLGNDKTVEEAIARTEKELDAVLKATKPALKFYDDNIATDDTIKSYQANMNSISDVVARMNTQDEAVKQDMSRGEVSVRKGGVSYDDLQRAINDYDRLNGRTDLTPEEETTLAEATRVIRNSRVGTIGTARRPVVSVNVGNIEFDSYLRAPLMAGDRLYEYIQRSPNPLVRPADRASGYERELNIINPETMASMTRTSFKKGSQVPLTMLPYSLHLRINRITGNRGSGTSNSGGGLFDDLISQKSKRLPSKSMSIDEFVGKSSRYFAAGEDDNTRSAQAKKPNVFDSTPVNDAQFLRSLEKEEYFGPHRARRAYADRYIGSPFERAIFMAICMAPNRITIHQKLAGCGQKLVNVMMMRLWIQHIMSSTLVMKAGQSTMLTAVGHGKVWVNSEQRGINIINAGFYVGTVRVNPGAIQMLPFTFPDAFVGGMNVEFLKDIAHFGRKNTEKGNIICALSPVSESRYEYPLHVLNLPTYARRDTSNAPYLRKWSSSEYLMYLFKEKQWHDAQGRIEHDRQCYGNAYDISLCLHRGFVGYTDGSGKIKRVPGTGPRGCLRMNKNGAEHTWNGGGVKFPE